VKNQALATAHIMAKKVVIIFLAWSYIYLLPYNISSIYELGIWTSQISLDSF
jgi:hypothetical protein